MKTTFQVSSAAVILSAFLMGCSSAPDQASTGVDMVNDDAAYTAGFKDGCYSGEAADLGENSKFILNAEQYATDAEYAAGWADAFRLCESRENFEIRQSRASYQWLKMDMALQQTFDHAAVNLSSSAGGPNKELTNTFDLFHDQAYLFDE